MEARFRRGELASAGGRQLVVAPARPAVPARVEILFPVGRDELERFEPPQGGINSAAGEARHFHDVEAKTVALRQGLEDEETRVAEGGIGRHLFVST